MPIKTFVGPTVSTLLQQAQATIGADAVILHVRRLRTREGERFEVTAADPATAARGPSARRGPIAPALELLAPTQPATGPLIIAVVGPTGVGKTTTIAKLAMHPRVFGSRRVALVGLDTFRIGAVEQLRTYAQLARLPSAIVYDEEDLPAVRESLAQADVWLVDCPGRSPRHRLDRDQADQLLAALRPAEVHLALAAATAVHVARAAIAETRPVPITHLLVTKLDEAPDEAGLFEIAVDAKMPIRWVTDGQDVPLDLAGADDAHAAPRMSREHGAVERALAEVV